MGNMRQSNDEINVINVGKYLCVPLRKQGEDQHPLLLSLGNTFFQFPHEFWFELEQTDGISQWLPDCTSPSKFPRIHSLIDDSMFPQHHTHTHTQTACGPTPKCLFSAQRGLRCLGMCVTLHWQGGGIRWDLLDLQGKLYTAHDTL